MSHIHFIGGEKGGVGKSVVARVLAQWCIDRSLPFAAVDADQSHGALLRFYTEFTQAADLSSPESADQIMDRALGAERRVLVDLPAQSASSLETWLREAGVLDFCRDMGVALTLWHVSDGGFASVTQLERSLQLFGDRVKHIVVKNRGRSSDFSQFENSEARQRLADLQGQVLEFPALDSTTMYKIDRTGSSFWAAIHGGDAEFALRALERQRAKLWLEHCYTELSRLGDRF